MSMEEIDEILLEDVIRLIPDSKEKNVFHLSAKSAKELDDELREYTRLHPKKIDPYNPYVWQESECQCRE